jgi:hypothetical protein
MQYSFKNTLCGLAIVVAAAFLAEQASAQVDISLEDDNSVSISSDLDFSIPEEISLFEPDIDGDISLGGGLISPSQAETGISTDVIPMEVNGTVLEPEDDPDEDDLNISISAPDAPSVKKISNPLMPSASGNLLGSPSERGFDENIITPVNNELFNRMSDLERQTTLLNLELKKERVANEVAAVKAQRLKAQQEEDARQKELERKQIEWENEQKRLLIEEERKLKEAAIEMEKTRQEKIVKAYKETMLENTQKWIKKNAEIYAVIAEKDAEYKDLMDDVKNKVTLFQQKSDDLKVKAETARVNHEKKVANLESQISIMKSRLEAEIETAKKKTTSAAAGKKNPFATDDGSYIAEKGKAKLNKEYAIMEIIGQGEELAAKLITADGNIFMAKIGTTLQNGYIIDEITQTYLSAVRDNQKDYLYFSAGGILDREPPASDITLKSALESESGSSGSAGIRTRNVSATMGIPSLSKGMIIR